MLVLADSEDQASSGILQFCFIKVLTIGISRNELPIFIIVLPIPIPILIFKSIAILWQY